MSQGCSQDLCPLKMPHNQDIQISRNRILAIEGRIPPNIWQDPLARPWSPAGFNWQEHTWPAQVHQDPDWHTRLQQGTGKSITIVYHVDCMIKTRGPPLCSPHSQSIKQLIKITSSQQNHLLTYLQLIFHYKRLRSLSIDTPDQSINELQQV